MLNMPYTMFMIFEFALVSFLNLPSLKYGIEFVVVFIQSQVKRFKLFSDNDSHCV